MLCQHAQAGVRRRDEEIARLAERLEAAQPGNTEALELRVRQQAETIVQLHGQLEEATSHVQTLTATSERVKAAEASAKHAVAAQKVCLKRPSSAQTLTEQPQSLYILTTAAWSTVLWHASP